MSEDCHFYLESPQALLSRAEAAGLVVQADGDRLRVRGPQGAEELGRALMGRKEEVLAALRSPCTAPPVAPEPWDATAAEASAARWSGRLREQLWLTWLTAAQRRILQRRLAIIADWLRDREPLLLDEENMQLWIEGTFAGWTEARSRV